MLQKGGSKMIFDELKKDDMGYYVLDDIIEQDKNIPKANINSLKTVIIDGKRYYFKSSMLVPELKAGKIAGDRSYLYSEMAYSKLYKMFGLDTVEYRLASINGVKGVVSEDYKENYSGACTLKEYLSSKKTSSSNWSLKFLHSQKCIEKQKTTFKDQLELACLLYTGTGNVDGHFSNIAVAGNRWLTKLDKVLLLDFGLTLPAHHSMEYLEKKFSLEAPSILFKFGIDDDFLRLGDFYEEMSLSQNISTSNIKTYLDKLDDLLTNDKCFKNLQAEVEEEYDLPLPQEYLDKLKFVMTKTGEGFQKSYETRLSEMGE